MSQRLTPRAAMGDDHGAASDRPVEIDDTDYAHRHFVNLAAAAFLLFVSIGIVWTIKAMDAYEKQRACLDSGRRECVQLEATRHWGIRPPEH